MKIIVVTFLMLFMPAAALGADRWTWSWENTALEALFETTLLIDRSQTLEIGKYNEQGGDYYERNPLLGQHPSGDRVNAYFLTWAVLHPVISYYMPKPWCEIWQGVSISLELFMIESNRHVGLEVGLRF